MGRSGHSALIIGISASVVLATGIGVSLTRGDEPVTHAETTLGPVSDASVVSANGLSLPAHAGTILAPGDVVTTGPNGNAALLTRGRVTLLTSNAALAVRDGAHQQLRTGTAVIDAQDGPALTLDIAGDTLVVPHGSATEADRAAAVRIGSLAGPASVTNSSGRHLSVAPLWQVILNGDSLPGEPTPLQLSDLRPVKAAEARAVPELVADNVAMEALARGINSTGSSTANVIEAAWTGTLVPRGVGVSRSDQVLPVVIADATRPAGGTPQDRYDRVVRWRSEGGSWGVVVHLLAARASQIADTLHSLQRTQQAGSVGNISASGLGVTPLGPGAPTAGHKPPGHNSSPPTTVPTKRPPPPATTGGKAPKPNPAHSPNLLGGLVGTVGTVINHLLSLLPSNHPAATTHVLNQQTSTSAAPTVAGQRVPTATSAPSSTHPSTATATSTASSTSTATSAQPATATPSPSSSSLVGDLLGGVLGGLTGQ